MYGLKIISLVVLVLFAVFSYRVDAQDTNSPKKEEYQLPYPGILPDSPLYSLKAVRDRIISFLISDPLKKAEFKLLQADKRLQAGVKLIEKGKEDLAEETISKGENYFEGALVKIEEARKEGRDVNFLVEQASRSLEKHQEVVEMLEKKAQKKKEQFAAIRKRLTNLEKKVNSLITK